MSGKKITVIVKNFTQYCGKLWAEVQFRNGTSWVPSFVELADIIRAIGQCEDIRYPRAKGFMGKWMIANFVADVLRGLSDDQLRAKYKIPDRDTP